MYTGKKLLAGALTAAATGAVVIGISVSSASSGSSKADAVGSSVRATAAVAQDASTTTPIKHVVVLYDENVSFDHYFGTYPDATNQNGEPFTAAAGTPSVNNLLNGGSLSTAPLLTANPNGANPQRLSPSQAVTCDQNHTYTPEQSAYDDGLNDKFPSNTEAATGAADCPSGIVMDYFDGNTVTALWNLAQHFTLEDNFYDTQFGPSTPGALNVISGDTNGAVAEGGASASITNGTLNNDIDPYFDECSSTAPSAASGTLPGTGDPAPGGVTAELTGQNIGDLLDNAGLTWGWFEGGFTPSSYTTVTEPGGQTYQVPVCGASHDNVAGASVADYVQHHEPFQYYASTSNPAHLSPDDVSQVGTSAPAGVNHQYDLSWFNQAVAAGDMPAVSYLKPPAYEDAHAGYSDPLDEQRFLVDEIDAIEQSPDWSSTAIFIAYDDSDGWYDQQSGPIVRASDQAEDTLDGAGHCDSTPANAAMGIADPTPVANTEDRCGVGPRLPMLVISPYAKQNYVDNTFTEQASIPQFIEQNWDLPSIGGGSADATAGSLMSAFDFNASDPRTPAVILNDTTGEVEGATTTTSTTTTTTAPPPSTTSTSATSTTTTTPVTTNPTVASPKIPKVSFTSRFAGRKLSLSFTTKGASKGEKVSVRVRVYSGRHLLVNKAGTVKDNKVTIKATLKKNATGKLRVVVTVDAGGRTKVITKTIKVKQATTKKK